MSKRIKNITGCSFGRMKVLSYHGNNTAHVAMWKCRCDCGTVKIVKGSDLRAGQVQSCGCLLVDRNKELFTKHGMTKSREYTTWRSMIERCENPNASGYELYGGRGITVCKRWRESFEAFMEDMGTRPKGHTLDRKNGDGNYEPDNCRWATPTTQQRNRRNGISLTIHGETKNLAEWADIGGVPYDTLRHRVCYLNWTAEKAVFHPVQKKQARRAVA